MNDESVQDFWVGADLSGVPSSGIRVTFPTSRHLEGRSRYHFITRSYMLWGGDRRNREEYGRTILGEEIPPDVIQVGLTRARRATVEDLADSLLHRSKSNTQGFTVDVPPVPVSVSQAIDLGMGVRLVSAVCDRLRAIEAAYVG